MYDIVEKEKARIRKIILLNGNRMNYLDLIQRYDLSRTILDECLKEMNIDGDIFEPSFGFLGVVQ